MAAVKKGIVVDAKLIVDDLYLLPGLVNVYLMRTTDGYALIDTGFPKSAGKILGAVKALAVEPAQIRHIVLTHGHPDHIGSAAALKRATGATVYAHELEAPIIKAGKGFRKAVASPGIKNWVMTQILLRLITKTEPTDIDKFITDGESVPFDRDLIAIHIPGHCTGQLAFLWKRHGGVLFTADACINVKGMALTAAVEDLEETRRSLIKLCGYTFNTACFGHGPPITNSAGDAFREQWMPK